ncbi:hypothetical protein [Holospora curviuscula]|uniref:Tc1-like transposase DDE domain-containing protein n=1 Tax=Holospora curviuscula TaxID=1082868 RepID=A0A2S5RAA1_9PROT|nr:hypothetical protein [Holospora curviuscula]PPE04238.1 hypothetical protein HCUR_00429 [Holospora curviuscula]
MGATLGAIELLAGSGALLICWVEEKFLPNIPENRGIVMNNTAFHKEKAIQKIIKDPVHTLLAFLFF